jgi:Glycosyltransferase family 87
MQRAVFAALSFVLVLAAFVLADHGYVERQSFKAFYCAGVAVRERRDPYRVEPLRSCERRLAPSTLPSGYVEPAPLPSYALIPFAALSALPPKAAALLFAIALALAAVLSAQCLAAILPASPSALLLALAPLTLLNVAYGEIPPLATLAICSAAYFLKMKRPNAAGIAVTLALVQPNVGLPAALAVFLFAARARTAIVLSALALALAGTGALGIEQNKEYFAQVLPLLANAELVASDQYSLSRVLFAAGLAPGISLLLGKIWFACTALFGIGVAGILAVKRREPEFLALLPPACVLLLGIYLHDIQMLIALPAAFAVASRVDSAALRAAGATALALLIGVWTQHAGRATILLNFAGTAGGVYAVLPGSRPRRAVWASAIAVGGILCLLVMDHFAPPLRAGQMITHDFSAKPDELSPIAWSRYLRATPALMRPIFAAQLPAWLGLLALVTCALGLARGRGSSPTPILSESREPRLANGPYSESLQRCD